MQSLVKQLNVRKKEKHKISLGEKVNQRVSIYRVTRVTMTSLLSAIYVQCCCRHVVDCTMYTCK